MSRNVENITFEFSHFFPLRYAKSTAHSVKSETKITLVTHHICYAEIDENSAYVHDVQYILQLLTGDKG